MIKRSWFVRIAAWLLTLAIVGVGPAVSAFADQKADRKEQGVHQEDLDGLVFERDVVTVSVDDPAAYVYVHSSTKAGSLRRATVTFSVKGPGAASLSAPSVPMDANGVAGVRVVASVPGNYVITASDGDNQVESILNVATTVAKRMTLGFFVDGAMVTSVPDGTPVEVRAYIVDASGNLVANQSAGTGSAASDRALTLDPGPAVNDSPWVWNGKYYSTTLTPTFGTWTVYVTDSLPKRRVGTSAVLAVQ